MRQHNKEYSTGFTLLELLIVIAIIGLLASVVMVQFPEAQKRARIAQAWSFSDTLRASLQADMVGWWAFDETSGGTAQDKWTEQKHGTVNGATFQSGIVNNGLIFDGNDSVIITSLDNFPSNVITVEFWLNTSDTTRSGTVFSYASSGSSNDFMIFNYGGFAIYRGGGVATGVAGNDGDWVHIAVTWQSTGGQAQLYKNGQIAWSGSVSAGTSITSGGTLVIGQEQDCIGGCFDPGQAVSGLVDEVRVYSLILQQSAIQQHYAEGLKNHRSLVMSDF